VSVPYAAAYSWTFRPSLSAGERRLEDDDDAVREDDGEDRRLRAEGRRGVEQEDVCVHGEFRDDVREPFGVRGLEVAEVGAAGDDGEPEPVVRGVGDGDVVVAEEEVVERDGGVVEAGVEEEVRESGVGVDDGDVVAVVGERHPECERGGRLPGAALPARDGDGFDHTPRSRSRF